MLPILAGIIATLVQAKLPKIAEAVADKGIDYVEQKLGVKLEPDMSTEKLLDIQMKAMQHEEFLIEQDNKNTDSARDLQKTALQQDDLFSKRFIYYFATFWSLVAAFYVFGVTFWPIAETGLRMADTLTGVVIGSIVMPIVTYFFGSSYSSKGKTDKILELAKGNQDDKPQ